MTLAEAQEIISSAAERAHRNDFPPVVENDRGSEYEALSHHAEYGAAQH